MRTIPNASNFRDSDYRQVVNIVGSNHTITEENIYMGTFTYDSRYLEGSSFQIGTAIADEIRFSVDNTSGVYGQDYVGEEFTVSIAALDPDDDRSDATWYTLGTYVAVRVEETYDNRADIVLQDKLVKMDGIITSFSFASLYANLSAFCTALGITLSLTQTEQTFLSSLTMYNLPTGMTYRDFVRGCALLMWENAYIGESGLAFRAVTSTNQTFTPADRFSSHLEEQVTIGPVIVQDSDGTVLYSEGLADGQSIIITPSSSPMIHVIGGITNLVTAYNSVSIPGDGIVDFSYYPLNMTLKSTWELCPGDVVTYEDKNGNQFTSLITSVADVLNGGTSATSSADKSEKGLQDSTWAITTNLQDGIDEAQDTADSAMPKYGTCTTGGSTTAKTVTGVTDFTLTTGMRIAVLMSNANTASAPTLNVNSTGAKTIKCSDGSAPTGNKSWTDNSLVTFVYDGTYWRVDDSSSLTKIDHIMTDDLIGTNGWINLKDGKFNYGSGKLVWNGSTLTVDGDITAKTGNIGGFTIASTELYKEWTSGSDTYRIRMHAPTNPISTNAAFHVRKTTGGTTENIFLVTYGGKLTAKDAVITGEINATSGTITGNMTVSGTLTGGTISGATIRGSEITGEELHLTASGDVINGSSTYKKYYSSIVTASATDASNRGYKYNDFSSEIENSSGDIVTQSYLSLDPISGPTLAGASIYFSIGTGSSFTTKVILDSNGLDIRTPISSVNNISTSAKITATGDITTSGNVFTNGKTSYTDGNAGADLSSAGVLHLQHASSTPSIYFYKASSTAYDARLYYDGSADVLRSTVEMSEAGTLLKNKYNPLIDIPAMASAIADKSLSSGTATQNIGSIQLDAGYYYIYVKCRFGSNATGRRAIWLSDTSTGSEINQVAIDIRPAVNGSYTYCTFGLFIHPTATTTYYLNGYQNSGSSLTVITRYGYALLK